MKKIIVSISLLIVFIAPSFVLAIDLGGDLAAGAAKEAGFDPGTTETTLAETLGTVVKTALSLVGVIFLSLMVYAGYLWMTARGEEAQIEKAQKMIRGAIIGLVITVAAHSITSFVVPRIVERTAGGGQQAPARPPTNASSTGLCDWGAGSSSNITRQQCLGECQSQATRTNTAITCQWRGQVIVS